MLYINFKIFLIFLLISLKSNNSLFIFNFTNLRFLSLFLVILAGEFVHLNLFKEQTIWLILCMVSLVCLSFISIPNLYYDLLFAEFWIDLLSS